MRPQNQAKQQTMSGLPPKTQVESFNVATPNVTIKDGVEKTFWTSIGSAFHGEKGTTIILNALPISGKLFISNEARQPNQ